MARNLNEKKSAPAWMPDLFGPIFKKNSLTVEQALSLHNIDEQIHRMATFVPDEIIYATDLSDKSLKSFRAVLMFLNISVGVSLLFKKYIHNKIGGSLAFTKTLNDYLCIVVREIYCNEGDILKFSTEGLLAVWKVHDGEFMFDAVQKVIAHATNIQSSIAALKDVNGGIYRVNVAISAGDVMFSVIGNDEARHFVIFGLPIEELKSAKKVSLPNDLVLSLSAWQHCTPSDYKYVIKDQYNIKIVKVYEKSDVKYMTSISSSEHVDSVYETSVDKKFVTDVDRLSTSNQALLISMNGTEYSERVITNKREKTLTALTKIIAINPNFGEYLKSYLIKPVVQKIEKGESLRFLVEIRRITVISVNIIPENYSNSKFSLLVDECYQLLYSIVTKYGGCIITTDLYEKNFFFCIAFGIHGYSNKEQLKSTETCKNGIICATHILQTVKSIIGVQSIFVGMSTGLAYCGVIGHVSRRYYAIIGPPVDKAVKIMETSYNKISCDYDTALHGHFRKDQFRSRGVRTFQRLEKCHIYEYLGDASTKNHLYPTLSSLDHYYPILGRITELDYFDDILDEIGVANRKYSGLLIEGIDRSGKSRLLDAFVTSVCKRQIKPIKLSLHATYAEKAYSVIYHLIVQILDAEDCETVEDREKELLNKLGNILPLEDFCYLNVLMRVCFPLSDVYCSDTDWRRHTKAIDMLEIILKQLNTKICILLDDIQYMDHRSWQFLSSTLDNSNIVVAMTMPKPKSWDDLSHVEAEIYKDKRIMKHVLPGLNVNLLPIFACQFLNVLAIPKKLNRILQRRKDGHIGWCEAFLISILQTDGLDFIKIPPSEVAQHDLIFPNATLVTKLPINLTPEELAPPLPWSQMSFLNVCVINEEDFPITGKDRDMKELLSEVYERMNPYEQNFIKCAATLGKVFKRSLIENVIVNSISLHTIKTISEMIRTRILECASLQRQDFHNEDLIFCIDKKRQTFSDMHHLVSCNCYHSRADLSRQTSLIYAHCKMLEFRISLFYKMMYNIQTNEEKQEHHTRATKIYGLDAKKCSSCGNGRFLQIFNEEMLKELQLQKENTKRVTEITKPVSFTRRRTLVDEGKWRLPKPRMFMIRNHPATRKLDSVDVCRVSIMPSTIDDEEDEDEVLENEETEGINESLRFRKRSTSFSEIMEDPCHHSCLEKFSHIDYRNCQCDNVITHLFWKLHTHIDKSSESDKIVDFLIQYSAGVIQIAQPLYALKLLSIAAEKSRVAEIDEWRGHDENAEDIITNKGIILALMGDAHSALGNYDQAKKYYLSAVKLRGTPPKEKGICYNIMSKMFCKLPDSPRYIADEKSRQLVTKKLELASYLRRLCVANMIDNKLKTAQSFALRSFKLAFLSVNSFLEKGEIYLATVRVLYCTRNIKLIRHIETLMLTTIRRNARWNNAEEITMVANIYLTMYQFSLLRGELEEAINMGIKVLKISGSLHLNKMMLIIIPSLIQITIWTRRINEAVDLMQELYYLADEDVDLSAKTWYYALSLDLMLDAGVVLESYKTIYNYYEKFIAYRSKFCVWRDPQSLHRLMTSLWIYQLRMGHAIKNGFAFSTEMYVKDITWQDFSRILTCSKMRNRSLSGEVETEDDSLDLKGLECYLLLLLRYINSKHELSNLTNDISKIIKCLKNISKHAKVIKPRLYLLIAYLNVLWNRKSSTRIYLYRAQKFATLQENQMMMAWIMQNERTWRKIIYNNMAQYWVEYVGSTESVPWQYICNFDIDIWSTIFYPLPTHL